MNNWKKEEQFTKMLNSIIQDEMNEYFKANKYILSKSENNKYFICVVYRNDEKYIKYTCSIHSHDYPFCLLIKYGVGEDEFPASDENQKDLILLIKSKNKNLFESLRNRKIFNIETDMSEKLIRDNLSQIKELIEEYLIT